MLDTYVDRRNDVDVLSYRNGRRQGGRPDHYGPNGIGDRFHCLYFRKKTLLLHISCSMSASSHKDIREDSF
jgi:hypothetical protein